MPTANACDYCRYRKRKCDRASPRCSLCQQRGQDCEYILGRAQRPIEDDIDDGGSGQITKGSGTVAWEFPSSYFLDHEIFSSYRLELPQVDLPLHPLVAGATADSLAISHRYFDWVHLWMPILSKKRWYAYHLNPLVKPRSDVKVLLFCMRLLEWVPQQDPKSRNSRTEDYLAAKQMFIDAERCGMLSLQLLQAMLLVLVYEYAHAIYPAAAVTASVCVRYGLILGINKQRQVELQHSTLDADEQEERRRVWWAIFILDRMVSHESSTCPEPRSDDLLPVGDHHWDDGSFSIDNLSTVTSPASTNMGMLARLSQAAYLLGRVVRHKQNPTGDTSFDAAERTQLDRALRSLINLTYEEGASRLMAICPQTAVCFSALVTLHSYPQSDLPLFRERVPDMLTDGKRTGVDQRQAMVSDALTFLRPLAHESWTNMEMFYRRRPWSIEKSSPLLTHWTYLIAITFMKIQSHLDRWSAKPVHKLEKDRQMNVRDSPRLEAAQGLAAMQQKLNLLGHHWCASDAYLRMLEARAVAQLA